MSQSVPPITEKANNELHDQKKKQQKRSVKEVSECWLKLRNGTNIFFAIYFPLFIHKNVICEGLMPSDLKLELN